jgi:iron complex transport system permease protein
MDPLVFLSTCVTTICSARTGYMHATYFLGIQEPAITIILFALMALAAYQASLRFTTIAFDNSSSRWLEINT